jgi:Rad3-related DNA helicases
MENDKIKISVRNLVEFVLRSGDLDSRFTGSSRAMEGTKAHQKLQKEYKIKFSKEKQIPLEEFVEDKKIEYMAEVSLKYDIEYKGFNFMIEGRADGIIIEGLDVTIDEIKSVTKPLELVDEEYNYLHWAQAKCYAYIYAIQNNLGDISVQITYYNINSEEIKKLRKSFSVKELEIFFLSLLDGYYFWASFMKDWKMTRDISIRKLSFPFKSYRKGQREFAVAVYRTIKEERKIFAQAPTGIGKTMSTLFPSIKAMGEGVVSKIFYLTAKTITRSVAEDAIIKMAAGGLNLKVVILTAKDKICFKEKPSCNPEDCEFAKGHFDRVNNALDEILNKENIINREVIVKYSKKFSICPFEFSLDLALWADCIICDYNYVFDPRVYLRRFFDNEDEYTFLIDEAHNLVDRAREMFSSELRKQPFLEVKKIMKSKEPKIAKALDKINSCMIKFRRLCEEQEQNIYVEKNEMEEIYPLLRRLISESEEWLTKNNKSEGYEQLLEIYFDSLAFIRISELYDERFITYLEKQGSDVRIKVFCLDPSYLLSESMKRGKSVVLFSATLSPIDYFKEILGGTDSDYIIRLPSPFSIEKRKLLIADRVSTKYKDRESSLLSIIEYISAMISAKKGNYLVFFPSYSYMKKTYEKFCEQYPSINTMIQESNMVEEDREKYLLNFKEDNKETLLAFAVLGGIFSEGIDLKGDRLIGTIIIGVGLPQLCLERDIIMNYFKEKNNLGYEYAYMYPGMNKVLQAAGRVIRTEEDKGGILLIDGRFGKLYYKVLFPKEWHSNISVRSVKDIQNNLTEFWRK